MNIYDNNGYLDMRKLKQLPATFIFIVGGRGIGKTYGALQAEVQDGEIFGLMRRTQTQADIINKPEFSPFKKLNVNNGWGIYSKPLTKYNSGFYEGDKLIGYTFALSTVANIRGFDGSDIKTLIYDEFIPEKHERPLKHEAEALFNAYETINRNREIEGEKPLKLICLSNANDLGNPVFVYLNLVNKAEQMRSKGQTYYYDNARSIAMFILNNSPISNAKEETALYRAVAGTEFAEMSLKNDFAHDKPSNKKSRPLKEYKPVVQIGELCIYSHKSNERLYATRHKSGSPEYFDTSEIAIARFKKRYGWLWLEYLANNFDFEEYFCELLLTKYLK